jgi:transcriptional regulator with XRE-family HTH domain
MTDNQIVSRIAQKIRDTRLEKNLTLQELANRTQVSKGLLSKIENSRTVPSLPVFVTLIQSLGISLKEFFSDVVHVNGKGYLVIKKSQFALMDEEGTDGVSHQCILSQNVANCIMEVVHIAMEPGATGKAISRNGYAYKYILSGSCELKINNDVLELNAGDSIYLDTSLRHSLCNKTENPFMLLSINFLLP